MGKKMKKIDRAGVGFAAIIGGAEIDNGTVQLRDLREGNQEELAQAGLAAAIANRLQRR
jgi:histidyl-tRNA synthetase